jgi:cytochrome c2
MSGSQYRRRLYVIMLLLLIPDLARAAPRERHLTVNLLVRLVADTQRGAGLFQSRCGICHTVQEGGPNLNDPHKNIPGDKMPFPGLPNKADRDDLISYLEQATQ